MSLKMLPRLMVDSKVSDLFHLYPKESGLKINAILRMSFRDKDSCDFIKTRPNFYQDMTLMFNTCRHIKPFQKFGAAGMLSKAIRG